MFIIFDLDGTLANIEHRLHFIQGDKKDWDAFHKACVEDSLIESVFGIFDALLEQDHKIEIWSGRSSLVRRETENWLHEHRIIPYKLLMRNQGDYTPDDQLKESWLNTYKASDHTPDLVFDDRSRLVEMWRRNGIQCCQVAPGDF
jgi:hypothetical protein